MKFSLMDMIKIVLIAAVGIWLLKIVFKYLPVPVVSPAVEGL